MKKLFVLFFTLMWFKFTYSEELFLKQNLQQARPGDYLVLTSNKMDTVMHIYSKEGNRLIIEEISIAECDHPSNFNWRNWVENRAPGNNQWVMYEIDLQTGQMTQYYSFTKKNWFEISDADNFLYKLVNLKFTKIPDSRRKKIGPKPISGPDWRPFWQPKLVVNGEQVKSIAFNAWQAKWPRDGSELSGKTIEVYLPKNGEEFPTYFPYWLQVNGAIGKAKVRIIDSGSNLKSPVPSLSEMRSSSSSQGI